MISKPTLFLSHAAKDGLSISLLKDRLLSLTGSALEIFLSSDGQSIPFGRNWVHEVEEALKRAKLMYVFISPAALDSRWVLFESGYAYAKGIRVVPVGILGVDLARIGPPLGLLQGFNVTSGSTMNNLVTIINTTFDYSFEEVLDDSDYEGSFLGGQTQSDSLLGRHSYLISDISFQTICGHTPESGEVPRFLETCGVKSFRRGNTLYCHGMSFPLHKGSVEIRIDPMLSAITFPILELLIPFMQGDKAEERFKFVLYLEPSIRAVEGIHKLSARTFGSGLVLADQGKIVLDALGLEIRPHFRQRESRIEAEEVEIHMQYEASNLREAPVARALDILFDVGALFFEPTLTS